MTQNAFPIWVTVYFTDEVPCLSLVEMNSGCDPSGVVAQPTFECNML